MIQELADSWQSELVAELEQELEDGEESIEERVVNASLRVMPGATKQGAEQLADTNRAHPPMRVVVPNRKYGIEALGVVDVRALLLRRPGRFPG